MGELLSPVSQSSLLLPKVGSHLHGSTDRKYVRFFNTRRSEIGSLSLAICAQSQQNSVSRWIGARVISDSKAPTLIFDSTGREEIEIETDNSGGDDLGSGGGEGRGGGGGGNNNSNGGEGGSGESDEVKKTGMSMSQKLTLAYAALVGVGGVMGYVKSGSNKSLIAGGLSALLLCFVYTQLPARPAFASSIGFGLSAALLGVMGSRFKRSGKIFPAGVVSLVSLVMSAGYLHGILRSLH